MTPEQTTALRAEIKAKCSIELLATRDVAAITATVNAGRTKPSPAEIGNGTILETLGKAKGNVVLDLVYGDPSNKYIVPLLEQGRLKAGANDFQEAVGQLLLLGVLSQTEADALCALGKEPDPVSQDAVTRACYDDNGKEWMV